MNEIEHVLSSQNKLGETPIWSPEENALYWVDWGGRPTCRFDPSARRLGERDGHGPTPLAGLKPGPSGDDGCYRQQQDSDQLAPVRS